MALIKCSECGQDISDKASACIHCGCPIEKPKRTVKIIFKYGLARCSVLIDNQSVGAIGSGTGRQSIELKIPIGTHNISVITQVKHGLDAFSPNAISQEQDGKQFEIVESDELIVIEILTKLNWTGSTGRCIIGEIIQYDSIEEYENIENEKIRKKEWNELTPSERLPKLLLISVIFLLLSVVICCYL